MQVIGITLGTPMPIPMLARAVNAGFPSPADDFIEEEIDLQRLLITNRPATFLVRVAGESMVEEGIFDGDIAIVDKPSPRATATWWWSTSTGLRRRRNGETPWPENQQTCQSRPTRAAGDGVSSGHAKTRSTRTSRHPGRAV